MPGFQWRVDVPASPDRLTVILDGTPLEDSLLKQYGVDVDNALLLVVGWTALLGDSPLENGSKPTKVVRRFLHLACYNLKGLIKAYAELGHLLMKTQDTRYGEQRPYLPEFERTPVYREYLSFWRGNRDPYLFQYLLSFCFFGKKAYFRTDTDLEATALHKWREVEGKLANLNIPNGAKNLRHVMSWIFTGWSCDQFMPVHGGGSVAEERVRGVIMKNRRMALTPGLAYLYGKTNILAEGAREEALPRADLLDRKVTQKAARLIFVPKDYKSCRSICMEPAAKQWAQQGVRYWLEAHIKKSVLRDHVFLSDQGVNRWAAMVGSKNHRYDTIDLSSASDSVSWDLVKQVFPPAVLKHLLATRTAVVKLPHGDEEISLHKYAPMGSALCFPVQCTIYSAITLMVGIAQAYGLDWDDDDMRSLDLDKAYKYAFGPGGNDHYLPFYVFGDDIITDHRLTSNVIEALQSLGFTVNVEKSFTGPNECRESCGGYYLNGDYVTPYTFKPGELGAEDKVETTAGLIDQINLAREYGYYTVRQNLISYVMHKPIKGVHTHKKQNPILFTEDPEQSFAILVDGRATNRHLRSRFNTDLQYREVLSLTMAPSTVRAWTSVEDNYAYVQWWRSRYGGSGTRSSTRASSKADVLETDVSGRWTRLG